MLRMLLRIVLALGLLSPWAATCSAEVKPLILGLFPNLSPRTLVTLYQPMRDFLEAELERPVELVTAANFNIFAQRMLAKEYDLVVAAPHLARLAQTDANYQLLARYEQPIEACVVVSIDSNINDLKGLANKKLAVPDKAAIVTVLGQGMMAQAGLQHGRDYQTVEAKSHNNAALSVVNAQMDAAVIGSIPLLQLTKEVRNQLRVIARSKPIPSQYFAASDRLTTKDRQKIERALFNFARTPGGKKFMDQYAMLGLRKVSANELKGMDMYVRQVRALLNEPVAP